MSAVTVVGNLQDAPELRFTSSGKAVANFTVRESYGKGEDKKSSWYDVTVWDKLAEHVAESLLARDRVIVVGRLDQQTWETQDGSKRSKVQIVAFNVGPDLTYNGADVHRSQAQDSAPSGSSGIADF